MQRRHVLSSGAAGFLAVSLGVTALGRAAWASGAREEKPASILAALARSLREIGTEACVLAAEELEQRGRHGAKFAFHVRKAGIDSSGANIIAAALQSASREGAARLASFSLSYNPALGDAGVIALAKALPLAVRELGLVGCGMGEAGGQALLEWASKAHGLNMICIEGNDLSDALKMRFRSLAGTTVYA